MKPSIVIIGANDFQNQIILKAKSLGYETHVFAWLDGAVGRETADCFYPVSIVEKQTILEKCRQIKPVGICSIGSDLAVGTVNYLNEKLGFKGNSAVCTEVSTNKYNMRKRFRERGIKTPAFQRVSDISQCDLDLMKFPLIVKPTDRSGSRGVTKVTNENELSEAIKRCIDCSFEKKAIVEEFIEGEEFSAESISFEGRHKLLSVTKKFTTGVPHFIETGHLQPAVIKQPEELEQTIYAALDALEIRYGASHSEFKIGADGSVNIIEIGARMGGDCIGSDLVMLSTGYDFLKMTLDTACGNPPDFKKVNAPEMAFVRFIFSEKDLSNLRNLEGKYPDVVRRKSIDERPGSHEVTDSSTRFGYFIGACGDGNLFSEIVGKLF